MNILILLLLMMAWPVLADAELIPKSNQAPVRITDDAGTPVYPGDATNKAIQTAPVVLSAGEDLTATGGGSASGVMVTEQRYLITDMQTGDFQVKGSAGFVNQIVCVGTDAAATAGTIKLHNALTEAAPVVWTFTVPAVALTVPLIFPINASFSTGIYLGFTTTADVQCYVSYR